MFVDVLFSLFSSALFASSADSDIFLFWSVFETEGAEDFFALEDNLGDELE